MKFLDKMLLYAAAHTVIESKRNKLKADNEAEFNLKLCWGYLEDLIGQLNKSLKAVGCEDAEYCTSRANVFDWDSFVNEILAIAETRTYILEYLCLGGKPEHLNTYFDGPGTAIKLYKSILFLRDRGCLDKQDEYAPWLSDTPALIDFYNIENDTEYDPDDYYTDPDDDE